MSVTYVVFVFLINKLHFFLYAGGASSYRWSSPAVLLLLETYRSMEQILNSGKMSHKQVWKKISEKLTKNGHNVTGPQCYSKLRSLKKTYKSTKDHNNKSGNDRKTWKFYEVCTNFSIFCLIFRYS